MWKRNDGDVYVYIARQSPNVQALGQSSFFPVVFVESAGDNGDQPWREIKTLHSFGWIHKSRLAGGSDYYPTIGYTLVDTDVTVLLRETTEQRVNVLVTDQG